MSSRACAAASAVRMSSHRCSRARSSKTDASSVVPQRWRVLLGVAQAGAHVGSHSRASVGQRIGDLCQRGAPGHDDGSVSIDLDVGLEQTALGQGGAASAGPLPWTDVHLGRSLAVEGLVDLLGSFAAEQEPRLTGRAFVQIFDGRPLDGDATAPTGQQVAGGRIALRELIELDDVGDQFDRRKGLGQSQNALRLVEQLRRDAEAPPLEQSRVAAPGR